MKLNYRPEIDGLRGIAVVVVILYHAQIKFYDHIVFQGGFIGVDIFFVISGYLITSLIIKELETTGNFSFLYFYQRRARRLLPVLFVVMLASLPFAWNYLLPLSFVEFSKSILYALGFSSNFYFHYSGLQYGAAEGIFKPFLHTWSLSIEEQFYLVFPICLIICFKYLKKYLTHLIILGIIISLLIADWGARNHPSFNFYVLPTRGWELLAGSLLAIFENTWKHRSTNKLLNQILPALGLLLIGHSIFFYHDKMFHPSFYTLSPVIGVCLIIWFSNKDELITKMLSSKLFVGTGLISYSLYLWHYPIFSFSKTIKFTSGNLLKEGLIAFLVIGLSIFSYFIVERPFRNKKIISIKLLILSTFAFLILISLINLWIIDTKGFPKRMPPLLSNMGNEQPWTLLKNSSGSICHGNEQFCTFNEKGKKKIFVIGDSHMSALMYELKDKLIKNDFQFTTMTMGCLGAPDFYFIDEFNKKLKDCTPEYYQKVKEVILKRPGSIIIFGGRLPLYLSDQMFDNKEGCIEGKGQWHRFKHINNKMSGSEGYSKFINDLLTNNNSMVLVYPIPEVCVNVPNKLLLNFGNIFDENFLLVNPFTVNYKIYRERSKESFKLLDSIQNPNLYRVYPHTLFCDNQIKDRCMTHDEKNVFYIDDDHPSIKGAEMINELIIKEIEKIEAKSN